jgi:hypothetical protein
MDKIYLPLVGSMNANKEHHQLIGPPGASMSDTLSKVEALFIPGTQAVSDNLEALAQPAIEADDSESLRSNNSKK